MCGPVLFLLAALLASSSCEEYHFLDHNYDRTPLGDAVDHASMKLLKESYALAEDKNVVESPIGLFTILALYSTAAEGPVREEIVRALGAANYETLSSSYSSLGQRFAIMDPSYLTLANKVFVSEAYEVRTSFHREATENFKADVEALDFRDSKVAAEIINKWSDEKTYGMIKEAVSKDDLPEDTVAALMNVIYFQGHWGVPFNASETEEKDFHTSKDTVVKMPTMKLTQSLFYYDSEDLGAKLIELPYKEKNFRMVVFLPNEIDGLPALLEKVAQKGILTDVFNLAPAGAEVILEMPKFEIKSKHDFTRILPKLGVSKIFQEGVMGIVDNQAVVVSKAFQKAVVKVDEEGATAAAFTGTVAVSHTYPPIIPKPIEFKVNHPFLFATLHQDMLLTIGAVAVPLSDPPVYPKPIEFKVDHPFLFAILHEDIVLFTGMLSK